MSTPGCRDTFTGTPEDPCPSERALGPSGVVHRSSASSSLRLCLGSRGRRRRQGVSVLPRDVGVAREGGQTGPSDRAAGPRRACVPVMESGPAEGGGSGAQRLVSSEVPPGGLGCDRGTPTDGERRVCVPLRVGPGSSCTEITSSTAPEFRTSPVRGAGGLRTGLYFPTHRRWGPSGT